MSIGSRIRDARKRKGMSLAQISQRLKMDAGTLEDYENGGSRPTDEVLFRIAHVLDIDANYIFQDYMDMAWDMGEVQIMKNYRSLDAHGKRIVDFILAEEAGRVFGSQTQKEPVPPIAFESPSSFSPTAPEPEAPASEAPVSPIGSKGGYTGFGKAIEELYAQDWNDKLR